MRTRIRAFALAGVVAALGAPALAIQDTSGPAAGLWHLVPQDADEQAVPQHRMDIRLYPTPAPMRAAIVNRVTNEDMPYAAVEFDGKVLRLGRPSNVPGASGAIVWLQLTWDGVRFRGGYVDDKGAPVRSAVPLKLIRSRQ
jgi:hypothetical protein